MLAAAMMIGCTQHPDTGAAGGDRKYAGGTVDQVISLKGCVQGAPDPNEYVLRDVQLQPVPAQPTDAPNAVGVTVTEGSTVRLRMTDSDELEKHLGQIVAVSGTIKDDGRSTIGTGGKPRDPDQPEPPTDASRAAANERYSARQAQEAGPLGQDSMSNGSTPSMSVQHVTGTGEACRQDLKPESRSKSGSDQPSGSSPQSK